MHLITILNKIEKDTTVDDFLIYMESQMLQGKSIGVMSKESPVNGLGTSGFKQLCDLWYPSYSDLKTADRKIWILTHYPILRIERSVSWKSDMYDATHPIYKHFTSRNAVNYHAQKSMAGKRGIEWKLDYLTWILWWVSTGKFDQRGVHNDEYQMCRKDDVGPYEWDNIYCDTGANNKEDFKKSGYTPRPQKEVVTPDGTFKSLTAAALHHNVAYQTILYRIKRSDDYYYA